MRVRKTTPELIAVSLLEWGCGARAGGRAGRVALSGRDGLASWASEEAMGANETDGQSQSGASWTSGA